MRYFRKITILILILSVLTSVSAFASDDHWANDEVSEFKQLHTPVTKTISSNPTVTDSEWKSVNNTVLNETTFDDPIYAKDWSAMLKMILDLPESQTEQLLKMYVFGLTDNEHIIREDAVGGLVKLLTLNYIKGNATFEELKDSNNLKDISMVSEKQDVLVRKAYIEGILDSTVTDYFRPKDKLTNAEAVSILNKVIKKYDINLKLKAVFSQKHWASDNIRELAKILKNHTDFMNTLETTLYDEDHVDHPNALNEPITAENWNNLLFTALNLNDSEYSIDSLEGYTYGLAENGYIPRDKAVAGMIKLLHYSGKLSARDATDTERNTASLRFNDYYLAFDTSKLAIALSEGFIGGYSDGSFKPKQLLTNAEAVVFISRVLKSRID